MSTFPVPVPLNVFDGLKKRPSASQPKKTKKKTKDQPVVAETPEVAAEAVPDVTETPVEAVAEKVDPPPAVVDDFDFSALKKKKKKTTKIAFADEVDDSTKIEEISEPKLAEEQPAEPDQESAPTTNAAAAAGDFDFLDKKKKKKKRPDLAEFEEMMRSDSATPAADADSVPAIEEALTVDEDELNASDPEFDADHDDVNDGTGVGGEESWIGTDREYTYPELIARIFKIIRQNNPDLAGGEKKKYTLVPPQVVREGTKKSAFVNVVDIARRMRREPDHLIQFLFSELGTTGSMDGAQRLVMKGRFQQKHIEVVLKRYITEYVTCKTCKSGDTLLTKENRLFFLQCQSCGSTKSVSAIKTGFMAQTTKRSVLRNATA